MNLNGLEIFEILWNFFEYSDGLEIFAKIVIFTGLSKRPFGIDYF